MVKVSCKFKTRPKSAQRRSHDTIVMYQFLQFPTILNQHCAGLNPAIFPIYVLTPMWHLIQYERTETSFPFTLGGDSEMAENKKIEAGPSE